MKKTIKLSEYCFDRDDIDYGIVDAYKAKYADKNVPNQPFNGVIPSEKAFKTLLKVASSAVNEPEMILHNKTMEKWITQQGGTFSKDQLLKNIDEEYYGNTPEFEVELPDDFEAIIHRAFKEARIVFPNFTDWILTNSIELYHCYKGDHRSSPGITGRGDRRDKMNIVAAISQAVDAILQLDPAFAGMRFKDGKYRNIFVDSFANYFRGCIILRKLFEWIGSTPCSVHYSDMELAELIVTCRAKAAYAADYKGMDMHFNLSTFKRTLRICADLMNIPGDQLNEMLMYADELFYQHLITPEEVYVGLHNLFSGIYPTHDMEGYMNMFTLIYTFTKLGYKFVTPGKPLKKDEFTVIVCGDDSIVLLGSELQDNAEEASKLHANVSAAWGQIMELSKVEYNTQWITFCKKTFALRRDVKGFKRDGDAQIPVFKYSVAKCLNALRHPEDIPNFPEKKDLIIWFCSIMDCARGCTSYKATVLATIQQNPELFTKVVEIDNISDDMLAKLNADWWFRNYAKFDLPNSETFALIKAYFTK